MPLLRFDMFEGRTPEEIKKILDITHETVLEAFHVPERDRYQIVHQHPEYEMIIEDTNLDIPRTNQFIMISIVSRPRENRNKEKFYSLLAKRLEKECRIRPSDLMINFTINDNADWSFGNGEAQFLNGKLN